MGGCNMKKISLVLLVLFLLVGLFGCRKEEEDLIVVDDDNYLVVNGVRTDFLVKNPEEIVNLGISSDGYWIIDNEVTNYQQNTPIEISLEDGFLVIFDYKTNIKVKEEEIVSEEFKNVGPLFPHVTEAMLTPECWIAMHEDAYDVILNEDEIKAFNKNTLSIANTKTKNILELNDKIANVDLINLIEELKLPNYNYLDNKEITTENKDALHLKRNLDEIAEEVSLKYGIMIDNAAIRTFPTNRKLTSSIDGNFDYFQETGIKLGEGVVIYHQTKDGDWSFVSSNNYNGWIETKYIATCEKNELKDFINSENFLIITGEKLSLSNSSYTPEIKDLVLLMGTKLPLLENPPLVVDRRITSNCYVVRIPRSDENGNLKLVDVVIPATQDVSNGYLPYTKANMFTQALKLLGTPYGWGDMDNNRDCSSTVSAVYNCFGFLMPRNTSSQDDIPGEVSRISEAEVGALIFTPGHVLLYLGSVDNRHYALHNFSQYRESSTSETKLAMSCNITTLNLVRSTGQMYLTSISKVISMQ